MPYQIRHFSNSGPRRLIKIPIGVYLLFILLLYNIYRFFHPERSTCFDELDEDDEDDKNIVFTTIRLIDFHAQFKIVFQNDVVLVRTKCGTRYQPGLNIFHIIFRSP